jgi:Tfp pilus assembly protein PilN
MVQFNLLPDIKIQYLRANRQKHTVVLVSTLVTVAAVAILAILLVIVFGLQKKNIADLNKDIKTTSSELQNTKDLNKILTVQNQLKALPKLHDDKPVATRLFAYLGQATPPNANNNRVLTDFTQHTISISGTSDTLSTVNVYIDRLKATTYRTTDTANNSPSDSSDTQAFSDVTLSAFGRDNTSTTYTITMNFDPVIFSEASDVTFTIGQSKTNTTEAGN